MRRALKWIGLPWLACLAWLGCNQILGNESAEFDPEAAARLDGSNGGDGTTTTDGNTSDGNVTLDGDVDAFVEDAGLDGSKCENLDTNPLHCGACNHSCSGGTCVDGGCRPVVLAQDVAGPYAIAVDATHVYWLNENTNTVWSVPRAGGSKTKLYEGPDGSFASPTLAVHAGNLYFPSSGDLDAGILKCATPACAGGPSVVVGNADAPTSVFVTSDGTLYFTLGTNTGSVRRCPLPCGVGTEPVGGSESFPSSVVVGADGTVYWSALPGKLRRAQAAPGGGFVIDTPVTGAVAVDAIQPALPDIYYIDETKGPHVVTSDGGPPQRLRSGTQTTKHLTLNGGRIYVSEPNVDIVYSCTKDGGCEDDGGIVTIATQQKTPRGIVVDPAFIFWANEGNVLVGGQIVKLAR